jgi:hypothetical protein
MHGPPRNGDRNARAAVPDQVGAILRQRHRTIQRIASSLAGVAIVCLGITGCRGRITGSAATVVRSDGRPTELAGTPVYLVPATSEVMVRLAPACDSTMEYAEFQFRRNELARRSAKEGPSNPTSPGVPAEFPRDPERLVPTLARARTQIDSRNQYAFESVPRGRYFVVGERIGWAAVEVGHGTARASLAGSVAGACTAVGAPGWSR